MPNTKEKGKLIEVLSKHIPYGYATLCLIAEELMTDGVTVQEWISVKDSLPPYNHDVLVCRPNMATKILVDCYVVYYGEDDGEWYEGWARYGKDIHNKPLITHWAYLPKPPKGE
jgi:hypothetical protein